MASITDNEGTAALRHSLQKARATLSRQQQTIQATIAMIKLLEAEIQERDKRSNK